MSSIQEDLKVTSGSDSCTFSGSQVIGAEGKRQEEGSTRQSERTELLVLVILKGRCGGGYRWQNMGEVLAQTALHGERNPLNAVVLC